MIVCINGQRPQDLPEELHKLEHLPYLMAHLWRGMNLLMQTPVPPPINIPADRVLAEDTYVSEILGAA